MVYSFYLQSVPVHSEDCVKTFTMAWYVPNVILRQDVQISSVKEEIRRFSIQYSSRLQTHPNILAVHLTEPPEHRRLKRHLPTDLITRFQE
jgi:hypothetical protein